MMRPCVLIVEDDPVIREMLRVTLAGADIDTVMANDGHTMWRHLLEQPDVMILDLCLPDADGLELLRLIRRKSNVPVLIYSTRSDDIERILGIELGADDFLTKPCNLRELLARVRALLRRAHVQPAHATEKLVRFLHFDGWILDVNARDLRNRDGQKVKMDGSAYALLKCFLEHAQMPMSREQLSRALRRNYLPFDRTVDVHVSLLRKLLGKTADGGVFIKSLRSLGYVFSVPVEQHSGPE
jgi:two-component system OmpR family response regulator